MTLLKRTNRAVRARRRIVWRAVCESMAGQNRAERRRAYRGAWRELKKVSR